MIPISNTELYTFNRADFKSLDTKEKINKAFTKFKIDTPPIRLNKIKIKFKILNSLTSYPYIRVHFFGLSAGEQSEPLTLDTPEKTFEFEENSFWKHNPFFVRNIIFYPENELTEDLKFKVTVYK